VPITSRLAGLHPAVRERAELAVEIARAYRVPVTVTSGFRSFSDQDYLWRRYLAGQSRYPAVPAGRSAHNYGLAWDSTTSPRYQAWWTAVREALGFQVVPSDIIHAQVPGWTQYVEGL
jgi:hypothetical protein